MTKKSDLKKRIRERMERTGERYTAARAHVLGTHGERGLEAVSAADFPGLLPGYPSELGGVHGDTALLARVLAQAGLRHPATGQPYSEAMVSGLCGGVGFLYAVFEYKGHAPMLTVVLRSRSMPGTFVEGLFGRVGAERQVSQTTSAKVATKALDRALEDRRPAVCVVDLASLPYSHLSPSMAGMSPHYVGVIGADGERVWLDDRSLQPLAVERGELDLARAGYKRAKRELFTVQASSEALDWKAMLRGAIQDTAQTLLEGDPTVPVSFRRNCGVGGMAKWRDLLTHPKDKKGWPQVFPSGDLALAGLRRAYDGIQHEYTPPAGGRPFYADFLEEADELLGGIGLGAAAELFRRSGEQWEILAQGIAAAPDAAVAMACQLADQRAQGLDGGRPSEVTPPDLPACHLESGAAGEIYGAMASRLGEIVALETRAAEELRAAVH